MATISSNPNPNPGAKSDSSVGAGRAEQLLHFGTSPLFSATTLQRNRSRNHEGEKATQGLRGGSFLAATQWN